MKIQFTLLFCFVALSTICGQTTLAGSITNAKTGEPLMYADVIVYNQNGALITGATTDLSGDYYVKKIKAGIYDLVFRYIGYNEVKVSKVKVEANKTNYIDEALSSGITLDEIVVISYNINTKHCYFTCGGTCCVLDKQEQSEDKQDITIKSPESLIYPNPASSYFNIKSEREIKDANIFNLSGQLVKTLNKGQSQVDVSDLIAGTYFLVITDDRIVQTEKIVIVKD